MNIFLSESTKELLNDEEATKAKLVEFLKTDENSQLVFKLSHRIKTSINNSNALVIPFMQLGFDIWAGLLTSYIFIYRRLYMAFIIAWISSIVAGVIPFLGILWFFGSIFVFGKLYEYFLIKKFIDNLNQNLPITDKCAPNKLGLFILIGIQFGAIIIGLIIIVAMLSAF